MKIEQHVKHIVEKRRNCSYGAISPLFHNMFNISLTSRVQLQESSYLLNVVNRISLSSILQIWYVEVWIPQSISESPLEFEILRVDCIYLSLGNSCHLFGKDCQLCSFCGCLIVFVCLSFWPWERDVVLIVSVPGYTYLLSGFLLLRGSIWFIKVLRPS